jgi:phage gpG-like protein
VVHCSGNLCLNKAKVGSTGRYLKQGGSQHSVTSLEDNLGSLLLGSANLYSNAIVDFGGLATTLRDEEGAIRGAS